MRKTSLGYGFVGIPVRSTWLFAEGLQTVTRLWVGVLR